MRGSFPEADETTKILRRLLLRFTWIQVIMESKIDLERCHSCHLNLEIETKQQCSAVGFNCVLYSLLASFKFYSFAGLPVEIRH
jgi:hypothetical protein